MAIKIKVKPKAKPFPEIPDPFGYGQRAVDYIRSLKHPKSKLPGGKFQLDPWQEEIIRRIYGPRHEDGSRVVKNVVLLIPRGNRKTSLAAAIALLHSRGPEAVPGGEILAAASDRKQAKIAFKELAGLIDPGAAYAPNLGNSAKTIDEERGAKVRAYTNTITFPNGSIFEAISSDAGTAQGRSPNLILADEIHVWEKRDPRELWAALRAGVNKVPNSLTITMTTAGRGQENLAWDVIDYARKVRDGVIDDPATLAILYEADRDCDWRDERVWHAVNPGLAHGYPDLAGLRQMAREAEHRPADRDAFCRYHLNIWQDNSASPFIDMAVYDQGKDPIDVASLAGKPAWIGVDLSSNVDLTAVVAVFKDGDSYLCLPWFFCPAENLEKRATKDGVPYPAWAKDGYLTPTPGPAVDYNEVENHIRDLCTRYDVQAIGFDPWSARQTMQRLQQEGLPVVEVRQGWATMSPMISELERAIISGKFKHGGNPLLRWCFDNVAVETDKAGNKSFNKSKSTDRIDGAVAAAMAVGLASIVEEETSIYDSDDFDVSMVVF